MLPMTLGVAVVNPFSEHPEEAMEYLSILSESMSRDSRYSLFEDMTEPVPRPDYEESLAQAQEWIDNVLQILEHAEEEDRANLEESLKYAEDNLEYQKTHSWLISEEQIEEYRVLTPLMKVEKYRFINDMVNDEESSNAFYELFYGENTTVDELLNALDRKIQMMRLEGN